MQGRGLREEVGDVGVLDVAFEPADGVAAGPSGIVARVTRDVRRMSAVVVAGAVAGFVVGGIGSRLAMMLIAALNRDQTGRLTDDRAIMGRFDLGETMGLVGFTTILGVLGGLIYLAVRDLRLGPAWFRATSIVLGPAVVVGSLLVHRDGIDFTVLQPAGLSIALFVAIPAGYAALISVLADRWLDEGAWPQRVPLWLLAPIAVPVLTFLPVGVPVVGAWTARQGILAWAPTRQLWRHPARGWLARAGLAVVFGAAAFNLLTETLDLT